MRSAMNPMQDALRSRYMSFQRINEVYRDLSAGLMSIIIHGILDIPASRQAGNDRLYGHLELCREARARRLSK